MSDSIIIPEFVLLPLHEEVIHRSTSLTPPLSVNLHNPLYGKPFVNYLLLTHWPDLIRGELRDGEHLLYNRYYWFSKFVLLYESINGVDAGLDQQRFQLLETWPGKIDWGVIKDIDAGVQTLS